MLDLYEGMLFPRMIEEKMLKLLRQGKVSKWFSGIGQESIGVGVVKALDPDEFIFSMHRHLGIFIARGIPLKRLMAQWQGKASGCSPKFWLSPTGGMRPIEIRPSCQRNRNG